MCTVLCQSDSTVSLIAAMLNKKPGPPDEEAAMPKLSSLGHVGLYVRDLPRMRDFYTRVLGLEVTDESAERRMVFLSSRSAEEHHEVLLIERREDSGGPPRPSLLQQVAFNVDSLAELRRFKRTFEDEGVEITQTVTHGNTASIYFKDPEGNVLEAYYTVAPSWPQPFSVPIDLDEDDASVLRQIEEAKRAG